MVDQNPRPGQQAEYPYFDSFRDQYPVPGRLAMNVWLLRNASAAPRSLSARSKSR